MGIVADKRNKQEQRAYDAAVLAGMMPADVEDALREAREAEQRPPTDAEMEDDSEVTEADLERDRQWWLWNPDVPEKFKRLLAAQVTDSAPAS